jgi:hypothetical protein
MSGDDLTSGSNAPAPPEESGSSAGIAKAAAPDPTFNEDLALALLKNTDLQPETLEQISKNGALLKSRKIKLGVVEHPKTPRHISLHLLRQLFTFDLMKVALTPLVAGDIKSAAEEALIKRLESLSLGERMSLARRASGRVAGALLLDPENRVVDAALENSRLAEALIIRALTRHECRPALVRSVCQHARWSLRRDIRVALLRLEKTPAAFAGEFAKGLPLPLLREILLASRLPQAVKNDLLKRE